MSAEIELKADCSRCAALCCVALAFDASEKFATDKPAGVACSNLDGGHGCAIHTKLAQRGFEGCVQYDCLGAGQRVTQEVFDGRSWREEPELLAPMMQAFAAMRRVHDMLQLMDAAGKLPLTDAQQNKRAALLAALQPGEDWTVEALRVFEGSDIPVAVQAFLGGLKEQAAGLRLPPKR